MLSQQIANGLATGLCYAVLACGMSLTYSASRVVNFAHGDLFVLGAFVGLILNRTFGLPFPIAAFGAIVVVATVSALLGIAVVDRIRGSLFQSVATIAFSLGLRDLMLIAFGSDSASFPPLYPSGAMAVGFASVPWASFWVGGLLACVVTVFGFLMVRSRWGLWMRASASHGALAEAGGISVRRMRILAFAVSGALAAVAAVVVGPIWQVSYGLGGLVGVKAFAAAVVGGFGNLRGAVWGGLALGLAESLFGGYVSSAWRDLAVYGLLIVVLLSAPRGLFGTGFRRVA